MSKNKTMERSMLQTLFKYLPGAYADFDLDGYSVTARIFGWNAVKSQNENKSRIAYELGTLIERTIKTENIDFINTPQFIEQQKFRDLLLNKGEECFDLYHLVVIENDDKTPQRSNIASVIRPYVFYCSKCRLIHIITDYKLTTSAQFLNNYKYRIKENFDKKIHKCMDCGANLVQQQIIRIDSKGNANDYEPSCDIHRENTKYYLKDSSVFDYRCSECKSTIDRKWVMAEKLTPALDPSAFFPQIISIVDTKDDKSSYELKKYFDLAKLLILREMRIINNEKYLALKEKLIALQEQVEFNLSGFKYANELKKQGIKPYIGMFTEPKFSAYVESNQSTFYNGIANRLLDIVEIESKMTVDFTAIKQTFLEDYGPTELTSLESIIHKLHIEDMMIIEGIPITNIAYGFTRFSPEIGTDLKESAILNLFKSNDDTYKFYSNKMTSEGLYIKFDTSSFLSWLIDNITVDGNQHFTRGTEHTSIEYFNNYIRDNIGNEIITSTIHTISHILMKELANASGLEVSSLSEMIFPEVCSIFIYTTSNEGVILNSIKTAVLRRLKIILSKSMRAINMCSLMSICNSKPTSACMGCVYTNEISCRMFNKNLNRSLLNSLRSKEISTDELRIIIKKGLWV